MAALGQALLATRGVSVVGDGEGDRLRVRLDGIEPEQLNRLLVQQGVLLRALVPVQKRLEDLFLTLTSQELT